MYGNSIYISGRFVRSVCRLYGECMEVFYRMCMVDLWRVYGDLSGVSGGYIGSVWAFYRE